MEHNLLVNSGIIASLHNICPVAIEVGRALLDFGFGQLRLKAISGSTVSANVRIARLAEWIGAEVVAIRTGSTWMSQQGWSEVDWRITRAQWERRTTV